MAAKAPAMAFTPDLGLAARPADSLADAEPSKTPSSRRARRRDVRRAADSRKPDSEYQLGRAPRARSLAGAARARPPDDADAPTPRRGGERRTRRGGGSEAEMHLHARVVEALRAESPALEDGGCWTGSLAWRRAAGGEAPWVGGGGDAAGARRRQPRSGATRDDENSVPPLNSRLRRAASAPTRRERRAGGLAGRRPGSPVILRLRDARTRRAGRSRVSRGRAAAGFACGTPPRRSARAHARAAFRSRPRRRARRAAAPAAGLPTGAAPQPSFLPLIGGG